MVLDGVAPTDEDDKVRRNLVAFSAAVLLLAWLEIPLSAVTEKLVGAAHRPLDPLRAWTAGAVVLFYLAVRFHFSGGGKTAFQELSKLWQMLVHWDLEARMEQVSRQDVHPHWWSAPLDDVLEHADAKLAASGYAGKRDRHFQLQRDTSQNEARWTFAGRAKVEVAYWNSAMVPPTHILSHAEELDYKLPMWLRVLVSAKALWGSWLYSEQAVAWMFPVWLALAASAIVGYRLGQIAFS